MKTFAFFFFIPVILFSRPCIEVIPDSPVSMNMIPASIEGQDYSGLSLWGKLKWHLNKKGYDVYTTMLEDLPSQHNAIPYYFQKDGVKSNVKYILCSNIPYFVPLRKFLMIPKEKKVLICWEPPTVIPFQHVEGTFKQFAKIITWDDARVDGRNVLKMHYPSMQQMQKDLVPFEERKLACMVIGKKSSHHPSELYSTRRRIIQFYNEKEGDSFHLYGRGWSEKDSIHFKGAPEDKSNVIKQYKFSYCLENCRDIPGYVTEKIFDCFHTGSVPIYLGANNITEYVPENCFIDFRDFSSFEEIHEYISNMSEEQHARYLQNIQEYLRSDLAHKFTEEPLVNTLVEVLTND